MLLDRPRTAGARGRSATVAGGFGRAGASAVGGLLLAVAFPPGAAWPLAVPAVAVLSLVVRGQRLRTAAGYGLVFGLAFFLPLLTWLRVVGSDAWVGVALTEAAFVALLGVGLAGAWRLPGWPFWSACLWVAAELARAHVPFGGFGWGRLAFSQAATPFTPYAALGGAALVTFAVALTGTLLAAAVVAVAARSVRPAAAAVLAALAVVLLAYVVPVPADGQRVVQAAVVQGNVPRAGLDFLGQRQAVLDNHASATRRYAARVAAGEEARPDLVIWPENSSDIDPYQDRTAHEIIDGAVSDVGVPTLVGAVVDGPDADHVSNVGIVWDPESGPGRRYVKRHPVPFGEYIPFRDLLTPYVDRLSRIPRDFTAGEKPGVLRVGPATVGDLICFEVLYDGLLRDVVDGGANVLVVQTNNATYGRTGQPEQQLAMTQLRAVEHGRATLVAATSGLSAVIGADGRVLRQSREFTADVLTAPVPLRDEVTMADTVDAVPEWLLAGVGVIAAALGIRRGRAARPGRSGRRPADPAAEHR